MSTLFPHKTRPLRAALSALALFAATGAALAQGPDTMGPAMAKLGGSMNAAARLCGDLDDAKAQGNRAQQRKAALERGVSAATFDKGFSEGESQTESRFSAMSPAEKQKRCTELKQFGKNAGSAAASKK